MPSPRLDASTSLSSSGDAHPWGRGGTITSERRHDMTWLGRVLEALLDWLAGPEETDSSQEEMGGS